MQPITPEGGTSPLAPLIVPEIGLHKQLQRWAKRKKRQDSVRGMYDKLGMEKRVKRMEQCGEVLLVDPKEGEGNSVGVYFHAPQYCRDRHCPICQGQRSKRWVAILREAIPRLLADNSSLRAVFLTLTIRNCPIEQLRETLIEISRGFSRMTRRKDWPAKAWIKAVEITRGQDGSAHPHLHVVIFLDSKYFRGRDYIKHEQWREMWRDCLRVDYLPMVNVQAIKPRKDDNKGIGNCEEVIQYTVKYGFKESELVEDIEWFDEFHKQVHATKAISIGGDLRQHVRQVKEDYKASRETTESVSGNDNQTDDVSCESKESRDETQESHDEILSDIAFAWNPRRGEYVLLTEETLEDVVSDLTGGMPLSQVLDRLIPYPRVWLRSMRSIIISLIRNLKYIQISNPEKQDIGDAS